MKKFITIMSVLAISMMAAAQSMVDALRWGTNYYYGTARTIAMGNAFTAIGGDVGSVQINPAGGSVAGYTQFTITPSVNIAVGTGSYSPAYTQNPTFTGDMKTTKAAFDIPNAGALFVFNVGNGSGLRSFSFGIIYNTSSYLHDSNNVSGQDKNSSLTGSRAYWATVDANGTGGMLDPFAIGHMDNAYQNHYWNIAAAYDGALINFKRTGLDSKGQPEGWYYGSAEQENPSVPGSYGIPGVLNHTFSTTSTGGKRDLVLNLAFDIESKLYVGVNLGLPMGRYNYSEYLTENADNPSDFPVTPSFYDKNGVYGQGLPTNYYGSTYEYYFTSDVTGVYGKLGVIWLPLDNLRVGAAIQTPTGFSIAQYYGLRNSCKFVDSKQNGDAYIDSNKESYRLNGPWEVNAGIAYTFGGLGLISLDYEMTDFSHLKYSNYFNIANTSSYENVNSLMNNFCGVAHQFRAGLEFNVLPFLSLRAGYNLTTDPEKSYIAKDGSSIKASNYLARYAEEYPDKLHLGSGSYDSSKNVYSISGGVGYKSPGSFFADLSLKMTKYPSYIYSLYSTYIFNADGSVYFSPEEQVSRRLWDISLTLGWRF